MKKEIGIITLHGYSNYGNRLQNYALKEVIEQLGFTVKTVVLQSKEDSKNRIKLSAKNITASLLNKKAFKFSRKNSKYSQKIHILMENKYRNDIFRAFSKKHLNEKFIKEYSKSDMEMLNVFSYFVVGSDQVWHPAQFDRLDLYFLMFTEKRKRIAYAPSFTVNELPDSYKLDYKIRLEEMASISSREVAGANIIKGLINIDAPVLVDPTMLLSKNQWLQVSKKAVNRPESPYILTYFLGGPSEKLKSQIEEFAKINKMTVINLGDISETESYRSGPSEFLDYINNASVFFTDSFHGVVFSIIFETPFLVYERLGEGESMYSRIETLLEKFNYRDREGKQINKDILQMDFSGAKEIIEKEVNKSNLFLKNAFAENKS